MMTEKEKPAEALRTKKQVVAGFIVFRRTQDGVKFLLLYRRGAYWNFPKGHFEAGETSMEAALREVEEETGLRRTDLRIIPGFRAHEEFNFRSGEERIHDTVILYLAETREARVRISPREHSGFAWFVYHDALKTIGKQYGSTKRALRRAYDFLHRRPPRHGQHRRPHPSHPAHHASPHQGGRQ